jgi:hypothetical protein
MLLAVAVLAGCSSSPSRDRAVVAPPPELLSAGALDLPMDCAAVPGAVYRAEYVVGEDGDVERVTRAGGPPCVRSALSEWVRTFHYAPRPAPASSVIDWMITVARK